MDVSCWFWVENGLNRFADQDDIMAVTRVINGGYNGLEERKAKLVRAKFFLVRYWRRRSFRRLAETKEKADGK